LLSRHSQQSSQSPKKVKAARGLSIARTTKWLELKPQTPAGVQLRSCLVFAVVVLLVLVKLFVFMGLVWLSSGSCEPEKKKEEAKREERVRVCAKLFSPRLAPSFCEWSDFVRFPLRSETE